jgi:hypothetical protein
MSQAKRVSARQRRGKAIPVLGAAGLLALASGASAEAPFDSSMPPSRVSYPVLLGEEEVSDVTLATFNVFDKEKSGSPLPRVQLARGGRGGGGCGCGHGGGGCRGGGSGCARGCGGGGGCRIGFGFGGCGGCGCAGCGLGWWGVYGIGCTVLHFLGRVQLLLTARRGRRRNPAPQKTAFRILQGQRTPSDRAYLRDINQTVAQPVSANAAAIPITEIISATGGTRPARSTAPPHRRVAQRSQLRVVECQPTIRCASFNVASSNVLPSPTVLPASRAWSTTQSIASCHLGS